jgi:hypothetical protein
MEYLVGVVLAAAVCVFAMQTGLDRDRAFYPTVAIVVASYYILFAVIGGSRTALAIECLVAGAFTVLAVAGFRKNLWLVAAALFGHGVFDLFHHTFIQNPGVPAWWPAFCMSYDCPAGIFLALLLMTRSRVAIPGKEAPFVNWADKMDRPRRGLR